MCRISYQGDDDLQLFPKLISARWATGTSPGFLTAMTEVRGKDKLETPEPNLRAGRARLKKPALSPRSLPFFYVVPAMPSNDILPAILKCLNEIEPGAEFSGQLLHILSSSGKAHYAKLGSSAEGEQ